MDQNPAQPSTPQSDPATQAQPAVPSAPSQPDAPAASSDQAPAQPEPQAPQPMSPQPAEPAQPADPSTPEATAQPTESAPQPSADQPAQSTEASPTQPAEAAQATDSVAASQPTDSSAPSDASQASGQKTPSTENAAADPSSNPPTTPEANAQDTTSQSPNTEQPAPASSEANASPAAPTSSGPAMENLQASVPTASQTPGHGEPKSNPLGKLLFLLIALIVIAGVGYGGYVIGKTGSLSQLMQNSPTTNSAKSMTEKMKTSGTEEKMAPTSSSTSSATPSPDATANWKTFTSSVYPFSVKYPTLTYSYEVKTPYYYTAFYPTMAAAGSHPLPVYVVTVMPDTFTTADPASYNFVSNDFIASLSALKKGETTTTSSGAVFTKLPDTTVDGQSAIAVSVQAKGFLQQRVYVKMNNYWYSINDYYQKDPDPNQFDLFLASFTFTK